MNVTRYLNFVSVLVKKIQKWRCSRSAVKLHIVTNGILLRKNILHYYSVQLLLLPSDNLPIFLKITPA